MLAVERRTEIEKLINEQKSVLVPELARLFDVTTETIRGDLLKLEKQGVLVRTYGGATLAGNSGTELGVTERDTVNYEGKQRIGRKAAELIRDGETIFLDASTSALHLARCIKDKRSLTVITNSNKIVTELGSCEHINVICTGGELNHRNMSYSGRCAEKNIRENYFANKFFFSCKGATLSRGLVDSLEAEAEIKKAMMANSEINVFLCDHNKLGKLGVNRIAPITEIDCVISDVKLDEEWSQELIKNDVRIINV